MSSLIKWVKRNQIKTIFALFIVAILLYRQSNLLGSLYLNLGFVTLNQQEKAHIHEEQELKKSENLLTHAVLNQSTNRSALWGLGVLFLTQGDTKRAQDIWTGNVIPVDMILKTGSYAEQERRWQDALSRYEVAALLDLSMAARPLGNLLNQEKNYAEAISVWQKALDKYPGHPSRLDWTVSLISSFEASQQWEQVLLTSQNALVEFPGDAELLTSMGKAQYFYLDDNVKAVETIKQAIDGDPEYAAAYAAIGSIFAREEQYDQAFAWYSQAIEHDPHIRSWYVSRANMARRAGDLDVAEKLYEEIIDMEPDYAPPYYELSWLLRQLGKSKQAIKAIENALSLHSSPPASYYYRAGRIYEWAGKREKSLAAYRQAANLSPNDSRILETLDRIQGR